VTSCLLGTLDGPTTTSTRSIIHTPTKQK
jgi:hypothetical protein